MLSGPSSSSCFPSFHVSMLTERPHLTSQAWDRCLFLQASFMIFHDLHASIHQLVVEYISKKLHHSLLKPFPLFPPNFARTSISIMDHHQHQQPFPSPSTVSPPPLPLGSRWPSSLFATPAPCTHLYNEIHSNVFYLIISLPSTLCYELFEGSLSPNYLFIMSLAHS